MKKRTYKEIIIEIFRLKKLMPVNFKTFYEDHSLKINCVISKIHFL